MIYGEESMVLKCDYWFYNSLNKYLTNIWLLK